MGMAVALVSGDQVIYARGFGLADRDSGAPATENTIFAIGSSTKAFTSAVVAMLADEGKVGFDDPLTKHLPTLKLKVRDGDREPTLRDAMCHRTGFPRMGVLWAAGGVDVPTMHATASNAVAFADFGEKFFYNNVVYAAAGEAAASAEGTTWADLVTTRVLEPLKMKSSAATYEGAVGDASRARGYQWDGERNEFEALPMRKIDLVGAAGSINSTVVDMAQWLRLQLGRGELGGERLISAKNLETTWTPQIKVGAGVEYGLGWFVRDWNGHRVIEHGGNIDGYAAQVAMLPDDDLGFVLLTNVSSTPLQGLSRTIVWESMLGSLEKDDAGGAKLQPAPYLGKYVADFGPWDDARFVVSFDEGALFLDVPGQMNYELAPPDDDGKMKFTVAPQIAASFELSQDGKHAQVLRLHQGGLDYELPLEGYVPDPDVDLDAHRGHLGRYDSDDGKLSATVLIRNNRLAVDIPGQMAYELAPPDDKGKWAFRVKRDIGIEFTTTKRGKVDGFVLHQSGTTKRFARSGKGPRLPTAADLAKKRRVAKVEKTLAAGGLYEAHGTINFEQAGLEGTMVIYFDATRFRAEIDFGPFGRSLAVYDGQRAWTEEFGMPVDEHHGKFLVEAMLGHPLTLARDWTKFFTEVAVTGQAEHDGKAAWQVSLRHEALPTWRALVDAKTGDVVALNFSKPLPVGGAIPMKTVLSGYRKAGPGARLPAKIVTENQASGRTIATFDEVVPSKADPATLFPAAPPSPK